MKDNLSEYWILDYTLWFPHSNRQQDSGILGLNNGFQSPGFQISRAKISLILHSTIKNFLDPGIKISIQGGKTK